MIRKALGSWAGKTDHYFLGNRMAICKLKRPSGNQGERVLYLYGITA